MPEKKLKNVITVMLYYCKIDHAHNIKNLTVLNVSHLFHIVSQCFTFFKIQKLTQTKEAII